MKYELPSTELIVIEENNYLKFGEYLNDMQCNDTTNKLCLDDLEYVKKLQKELECTIGIVEHNRIISKKNKEIHQLKDNWNKLKEYIRKNIIYDDVGMKILDPSPLEDYIQELEQGSDSDEQI